MESGTKRGRLRYAASGMGPAPGPGHLVCLAGVYPNPTARQAQTVSLPKVCRSPGRVPLGHHFNARQAAIVFELGFVP